MSLLELPLLSLLIWLPIIGGALVLFSCDDSHATRARSLSLLVASLVFLLSLLLWFGFDASSAQLQFVEHKAWIASFGIHYGLGVDGISVPLIVLTSLFAPIVIIAAWQVIQTRVAQYMSAFLIMTGIINGVFAATDAILYYIFWEASLIPMFLIVGIWGGPNRIYAAFKFFLYTFLGSVLMLIGLIYLGLQAGDFTIQNFYPLPLGFQAQSLLFFAFLLAFAVKVPMWPVHTWLPDAHVQAPTGGSVVLAAIMLKMGAYGFLRFSLPIVPDASMAYAGLMIALSLIAVVYIGLVAIVQQDMKKLIAYSSIAHMGFCTLGFFMIFAILANTNQIDNALLGLQGAYIQMISHGFISGALFLCVGVLYDRLHSREIGDYGGVANKMPVFAAFFMLFAMANSGLPGTSGFVGEFLVIVSAFSANFWIAFVAALTLILGPAYTLWMYRRVMFGAVANDKVAQLTDINGRERALFWLLGGLVLLFGLWPFPLLEITDVTLSHLLTDLIGSKL